MDTFIPMEKRTITRIIRSQYLDHVEKKGMIPTLKVIAMILAGILSALSWTYPDISRDIFNVLWTMENYILPKMFGCLFIVMMSPVFFEHMSYLISSLQKKTHHDTIGGVPAIEIIGYLFDNESFPREDVCSTFAITRNQYSEIVEVLDTHNILVRGENNSRVLNTLMPREMVVNVLGGGDKKEVASMIGKTFDFFASIGERIREHLASPTVSPRFERRKI